jgi:signal transduction histidine kinase
MGVSTAATLHTPGGLASLGQASSNQSVRTARASILIVDDVEANLLALEAVLYPLNCQLVRATSGNEALRHLLFHDFAVLLIDVLMPGLDGIATAGLIKNRPATRHVPIIFLTGLDTKAQDISQAYALGAVDYLVKPFDPDILRSKVAVFVELFLKRQELQVQTELAQKREREAIENRRLYETERGARAQAEEISRAREDIIAVVSHDLRNPMSSIVANAGLIKRKLAQGDTNAILARVETIERSVSRMDSLVNDLLDTARIQAGNLTVDMKNEDVTSLLQQIAEQFLPVLAAKAQLLDVVVHADVTRAKCDRERIFRVFSNLIGNASKFSADGETITVEASTRPGEILFAVTDRGCGISSDQQAHIFEPYWQASQQRRAGLGLGLAIVKGIIEAHGTRIWVESKVGAGSRFLFTLPSADGDDESNRAPPP